MPFASKPIPSAEESPEWRSILKECKHMFEVEYAQLERMYSGNPQTHALWQALTMSPNKEIDHLRNKLNRLFRDKKFVRQRWVYWISANLDPTDVCGFGG